MTYCSRKRVPHPHLLEVSMSANPNMKVNMVRFYYADGEERKLPRVELTVEGCYQFTFTCDEALRPVRVAYPDGCHVQIKRTALAHAAIIFKNQIKPESPDPIQLLVQE